MRFAQWGVVVASLAVLLVGCTAQTPGTAITTQAGTSGPSSTGATSITKSSGSQPSGIKPCELISSSAAKGLGITGPPQPDEVTGATACTWRVRKDNVADSYTLDVAFYEERGVKDMTTEHKKTPIRIGSHDAIQALGAGNSGCVITFGITETSRVDVRARGGESTRLCVPALDAAKVVEPELP